jgi:hypothetical protein
MKSLRIEMDRWRGVKSAPTAQIPADTSIACIAAGPRAYAVQYPHRARMDGVEVARVRAASRAGPAPHP